MLGMDKISRLTVASLHKSSWKWRQCFNKYFLNCRYFSGDFEESPNAFNLQPFSTNSLPTDWFNSNNTKTFIFFCWAREVILVSQKPSKRKFPGKQEPSNADWEEKNFPRFVLGFRHLCDRNMDKARKRKEMKFSERFVDVKNSSEGHNSQLILLFPTCRFVVFWISLHQKNSNRSAMTCSR